MAERANSVHIGKGISSLVKICLIAYRLSSQNESDSHSFAELKYSCHSVWSNWKLEDSAPDDTDHTIRFLAYSQYSIFTTADVQEGNLEHFYRTGYTGALKAKFKLSLFKEACVKADLLTGPKPVELDVTSSEPFSSVFLYMITMLMHILAQKCLSEGKKNRSPFWGAGSKRAGFLKTKTAAQDSFRNVLQSCADTQRWAGLEFRIQILCIL